MRPSPAKGPPQRVGGKRVGIKEGEGGNRILGVWGGCEGRKKNYARGLLEKGRRLGGE